VLLKANWTLLRMAGREELTHLTHPIKNSILSLELQVTSSLNTFLQTTCWVEAYICSWILCDRRERMKWPYYTVRCSTYSGFGPSKMGRNGWAFILKGSWVVGRSHLFDVHVGVESCGAIGLAWYSRTTDARIVWCLLTYLIDNFICCIWECRTILLM
jgi:hypothetical protein